VGKISSHIIQPTRGELKNHCSSGATFCTKRTSEVKTSNNPKLALPSNLTGLKSNKTHRHWYWSEEEGDKRETKDERLLIHLGHLSSYIHESNIYTAKLVPYVKMCDIFSNTTSHKNLHPGFSTRGIWKECYFNACFLMFPVVSRNIIWIHNEQIRSIAMHINLVLLVLCMQDRAGSHRCILKHALVQILPSAISVYLCKHVYTYIFLSCHQ